MQKTKIKIVLTKKNILRLVLIVSGLAVVASFITATSYTQLAIATLFYPPLIYCALVLFPRSVRKEQFENPAISLKPAKKPAAITTKREAVEIADVDKRAFLKMVGAAGLSFFIYSIFTRRVENLIPGRVPEQNLVNTEKLQQKGTDGYQISELDEGKSTFFGFTNSQGAWFIMKEDAENGSFRYTKGESNFARNWALRESLKYNYYHHVFP